MISRLGNGLPAKLSSGPRTAYDIAKTGGILGRGNNEKEMLPAAPWAGTWPAPGATLDLDFTNDRGFIRGVGQGRSMDGVTFSRASSATWVGPDGLLKNSGGYGNNFIPFPQNFENASWTKKSAVTTAPTGVAPDNTNTAYSLTATSGTDDHTTYITYTSLPATAYTFSCHIKRNTSNFAQFINNQDSTAYANFDLINGTVTATGSNANAVIVSLDNDWYRCIVTYNDTAIPASQFWISIIPNGTHPWGQNWNAVGTESIYIWGAQLELGSTASQYYPNNLNVPRFDWGNVTPVPNRNRLQYTEQFDNAYWPNSVAGIARNTRVVSNIIQSPSGEITADKLIATAVNGNHFIGANNSTINGDVTVSIFVKAGEYYNCWLGLRTGGPFVYINGAVFNLQTASVGFVSTGFSTNIESVGNDWFRISVSGNVVDFRDLLFGILDSSGNGSFVGDDVGGIYIWGAQIETGTQLTSYQSIGPFSPTNTPLAPTTSSNGLLIEEARTNRVLWNRDATKTYTPPDNFFAFSETFTNAAWNFDANNTVLQRITGSLDPSGSNTATLIRPTVGRTAANAYIGQRAGTLYPSSFSVYMSASGYNFGVLSAFSYVAGNFAVYNLASGSMHVTASVAGLSSSIQDAGNGWYRCSLHVTNETLNRGFLISTSPDGTTTAGTNGTGSIAIWGAHANNGILPTPYVSTSALPTPLWVTSSMSVAKDQVGIDGLVNAASKLTADANDATIFQYMPVVAGSRTSSVFLKRISGSGIIQVSLDGVTWSTVDIVDTEWRRIALSGTVANGCLGLRLRSSGDVIAMDYGQVEDGGFATSPILTTGATSVRSADIARVTPLTFPAPRSPSNNTIYAESIVPRSTGAIMFGYGASVRSYLGILNTSQLYVGIFDGIVGAMESNGTISYNIGDVVNIASSYSRSELFNAANGINTSFVMHDEDITVINLNFSIGFRPDNVLYYNGPVRRVVYFPRKMQGNELLALTNKTK
jgi:hypothetical protein